MARVGYTRFGLIEDEMLIHYHNEGMSIADQAAALDRSIGSIKSRRRILGLSKPRAAALEQVETPAADPHLETMRKLVVYFFGLCLATAGVLAILGDV